MALTRGSAVVTLDPAIFGNIIAADAYSATGDQVGSAQLGGQTVAIEFSSVTGGLGRRPDLPVFSITVPVLATAKPGAAFTLAVNPGATTWLDTQGVPYSFSVVSGTFTVGGSASIANVGIVGGVLAGLLPGGTVVEIDGTGFTSATVVSIDGVAIAATQFISPTQINVTLAGAADLDFRRVAVQNPGEAVVQFYPVLHGNLQQQSTGVPANLQPIFPLQLYQGGSVPLGSTQYGFSLQNPSSQPVGVTVDITNSIGGPKFTPITTTTQLTLSPSGDIIFEAETGSFDSISAVSQAPIRMALIATSGSALANAIYTPISLYPDAPPIGLAWNWNAGDGPPAPITANVITPGTLTPFTASASTQTGNWLSVSPTQGIGCPKPSTDACPLFSLVNLQFDPTGLSPGQYQGTVTITGAGPGLGPVSIPVYATVTAAQTISSSSTNDAALLQYVFAPNTQPVTLPLTITSNDDPTAFTVSTNVPSGQKWLSVNPNSGQTPLTLTVTLDPAFLSGGCSDAGTITIQGPSNLLSVPIVGFDAPQPAPCHVLANSRPFTFYVLQEGPIWPASQTIASSTNWSPVAVSATTVTGGNWLSVAIQQGNANPSVLITVNPTGLAAGTYQGTAKIITKGVAVTPPSEVPVTLVVASKIPPLSADVPSLSMTGTQGAQDVLATFNASSGNFPSFFSVSALTTDGEDWLYATYYPSSAPATSWPIYVGAYAAALTPGTYTGKVTITAQADPSDIVVVPVTFTVTPKPPAPPPLPQVGPAPIVSGIVNAASQSLASISPGEIVTIFGQNIGSYTPVGPSVDATGKIATTAGGVQVLFDGIAAPILYASASQINAVVPYEVSGSLSNVSIQFGATAIPAGAYSVVPTTPGIFSVLNQDNSPNSAANPAARGSVVQIYTTGEGATSPPGITGELIAADTKQPIAPIAVTVGGVNATVTYSGSAPDAVTGLFQVDAIVPANLPPGTVLPLLLTAGKATSQPNVSLFVK